RRAWAATAWPPPARWPARPSAAPAPPRTARSASDVRRGSVACLEETSRALAAADAHRHHAVARLALEHLVGDGADHARARHAERMADGDRAAVRVELLGIQTQRVADVHDLRGERLVGHPAVEVVER